MRLKKLIVQGFKSFADRTEFLFDSPITGIVGPNGCGKSNVVDAFKWVLGEQSAKSLRGDAMMDVIFNGSSGRKPAGMSEVTLVFENPLRPDGGRALALDTDEVTVGRRLFRDGTSEYQLNNASSRLRDIRELFLDTGVGVDAYSVIEQGRVAALLEANPEERRLIFEEAAGVSKFKQKKKEAERKLDRVDQNLLRVNDIVEEVEKRLRSVKVQAGRARTYQEHATRLRELRLMHALREYHVQHGRLCELDAAHEDARFRLDDAAGDLAQSTEELNQKRQQQAQVNQQRQGCEYELVQARASLQSARQRQAYAQQQLGQIAEQLSGFDRDREESERKRVAIESALEEEARALEELTAELETHKVAIEQKQQAFRDGQLKLNQLNQQSEGHKSAILDLMRRLAGVNSRLGAIEIERKNITAQQMRLGERRQVVVRELGQLDAQRARLQEQLDAVVARASEQQRQLEVRRSEAAALGKQIADLSEQLGRAKEHRSGLLSRQKLLQDLEAKREGVSEGVKSVLRQREEQFSFVRGLVADVLRVDVEHAHAIEAALDGRDQWLVADHAQAVFEQRELFEELEGRVNVLCVDGLRARDNGYDWNAHPQRVRYAVDLVRFEPADAPIAEHLLGRTVVVEELSDAVALHREGPSGYRYVTLGGEVLEADGVLRAGPLGATMGLLSRRSELEAVTQQIAEVDGRIEHLTQRLTQGNAQSKALADAENALRNEIYQTNTQKVELNSQIAGTTDKQNALSREQPVLDRELGQLLEQVGRLKTEQEQLGQKQRQLDTDQQERQAQIELLSNDHAALNESLKSLGEALTGARVRLGQVQEKQLASRQQVQRQTAARQELVAQIERMARSAQALHERREQTREELASAEVAQRQLEGKIAELSERTRALEAQVSAVGHAVGELTAQLRTLGERHEQAGRLVHELELKTSELRVRLDALVQRTREELELDLPERYAELSQPADDGTEGAGYVPEDMDWDAVAEEIKALREKIQRLGNVNLDAISEQEELEQREQFLSAQVADLSSSKQQLQELIATINTESGLRFEQTFNAVREHFQTMFRKLFGGGKADIFLETEIVDKKAEPIVGPNGQPMEAPKKKIDILDAGIEIIARPPGKQPVSISQLSGGEKTMTCVALLLSIFKSKPSPFCILDEVDAALDEANNVRFNAIVQEFLDQSQFIVITHSKRTMQIADVLYGVTMQEQGVSKRVAVKFDQVDQQGRITEPAAA